MDPMHVGGSTNALLAAPDSLGKAQVALGQPPTGRKAPSIPILGGTLEPLHRTLLLRPRDPMPLHGANGQQTSSVNSSSKDPKQPRSPLSVPSAPQGAASPRLYPQGPD